MPLKVERVEPRKNVYITFNIPKDAAQRLKRLAESEDKSLQELGILSVKLDGDTVVPTRLSGDSSNSNRKWNGDQLTEKDFDEHSLKRGNGTLSSSSNDSTVSFSKALSSENSMKSEVDDKTPFFSTPLVQSGTSLRESNDVGGHSAGSLSVEATRRNIAQYLSGQHHDLNGPNDVQRSSNEASKCDEIVFIHPSSSSSSSSSISPAALNPTQSNFLSQISGPNVSKISPSSDVQAFNTTIQQTNPTSMLKLSPHSNRPSRLTISDSSIHEKTIKKENLETSESSQSVVGMFNLSNIDPRDISVLAVNVDSSKFADEHETKILNTTDSKEGMRSRNHSGNVQKFGNDPMNENLTMPLHPSQASPSSNVALTSPLLVNLLQSDGGGSHLKLISTSPVPTPASSAQTFISNTSQSAEGGNSNNLMYSFPQTSSITPQTSQSMSFSTIYTPTTSEKTSKEKTPRAKKPKKSKNTDSTTTVTSVRLNESRQTLITSTAVASNIGPSLHGLNNVQMSLATSSVKDNSVGISAVETVRSLHEKNSYVPSLHENYSESKSVHLYERRNSVKMIGIGANESTIVEPMETDVTTLSSSEVHIHATSERLCPQARSPFYPARSDDFTLPHGSPTGSNTFNQSIHNFDLLPNNLIDCEMDDFLASSSINDVTRIEPITDRCSPFMEEDEPIGSVSIKPALMRPMENSLSSSSNETSTLDASLLSSNPNSASQPLILPRSIHNNYNTEKEDVDISMSSAEISGSRLTSTLETNLDEVVVKITETELKSPIFEDHDKCAVPKIGETAIFSRDEAEKFNIKSPPVSAILETLVSSKITMSLTDGSGVLSMENSSLINADDILNVQSSANEYHTLTGPIFNQNDVLTSQIDLSELTDMEIRLQSVASGDHNYTSLISPTVNASGDNGDCLTTDIDTRMKTEKEAFIPEFLGS